MKDGPDWSDLRLFVAVAREGGIGRAAPVTGVSPATLSRRMRALESDLGRALFRRGPKAYALTAEGHALAAQLRPMEEAAAGLVRPLPQRVRISAGTWTTLDLARNIDRIWRRDADWVPEFVYCDRPLDIARREVDIGIRNRAPDQPWLAGRRVGYVDYGVYAANEGIEGWIGPAEGTAPVPSGLWIEATHGTDIVTRANTPIVAATLAEAGLGRVVLPTFIGESRDGLTRLGPTISDLRSEEWLVAHHEGRHLPPVRRALAALSRYLRRRSA